MQSKEVSGVAGSPGEATYKAKALTATSSGFHVGFKEVFGKTQGNVKGKEKKGRVRVRVACPLNASPSSCSLCLAATLLNALLELLSYCTQYQKHQNPPYNHSLGQACRLPQPPIAVGHGGYSRAITIHPDGVDVGLLPAPAPQTGAVLSELHAAAAEAAPFKQLDAVVLPVLGTTGSSQ